MEFNEQVQDDKYYSDALDMLNCMDCNCEFGKCPACDIKEQSDSSETFLRNWYKA